MGNMRVGIVGTGCMGSAHVRCLQSVAHAEVTAVCDLVPEKMKKLKQDGILSTDAGEFTDYRALIASGRCDLVAVAVPHPKHLEISLAVLRAGLHLMCEKPITVQVAEADALLAEAAKHDCLFSTMYALRPLAANQVIKRFLESGQAGRIFRVEMTCTKWARSQTYYDQGGWRGTWRGEGGGLLLNQAPHNLDALWWWFGDAATIRATLSHRQHRMETEDEVSAEIMTKAGFPIRFYATTGELPGKDYLEIVAENGTLVRDNGKILFHRLATPMSEAIRDSADLFPVVEAETVELTESGCDAGHKAIWQELAELFCAGEFRRPLLSSGFDGIHAVEWANAMLYSSINGGATVALPLIRSEFAALLADLQDGTRIL